jgi:uncharacterized protein (TIGR02466 family)
MNVPRMEVNGVWPTFLVRRQLADFEKPNEALVKFIVQQEARQADSTARFRGQKLFDSDNRAVRWLKDQIDQTAAGFLRHVGVHWPVIWTYTGWYNVNRYGDHHGPHNHPRSTMSGTYYVSVPSDQEQVEDPLARPACISFYDPRTGANMNAVGTEYDAKSVYVVSPTAGMLLMWPSPVQHAVHPNLSREHRISISFNLQMYPND